MEETKGGWDYGYGGICMYCTYLWAMNVDLMVDEIPGYINVLVDIQNVA